MTNSHIAACPTPLVVMVEDLLKAKAKHDEQDRRTLRRLRRMCHAHQHP